jgi:transketolase
MEELARRCRRDVLSMTTAATSGHLGGALSSIDIFTVLWSCARVSPATAADPGRDRIVVSHGHTAAAVYAVLGNLGYFDVEKAIRSFREAGSPFEGHPSASLRGVEWCSGSLGQGLSVGCGLALASRVTRTPFNVFVVMGDGEQQKGQVMEAAEFAAKYRLANLVALVDANGLQATGRVERIMPQDIAARYRAAGWRAVEVDGHAYGDLHEALRTALSAPDVPTVLIARTTMGSGVSFIEDRFEYHGKVLEEHQLRDALGELGFPEDHSVEPRRPSCPDETPSAGQPPAPVECSIAAGTSRTYPAGDLVDCRSAFGNALTDLVAATAAARGPQDGLPVAVLDCDLAGSVKTDGIRAGFPEHFFECGIQEHNAASVAAGLSSAGVLAVLAEFGVFGMDETYAQHRMIDLNPASLKVICTHCGLDVGEDGKTHQCIDWVSLPANLFSYRLVVPADANQADRVTRFVATTPGNMFVAMGRSRVPVLAGADGAPAFAGSYRFTYGRADWLREGSDAVIVTCGTMTWRAVAAHDILRGRGVSVGVLNLSCPLAPDEAALRRAAETGLIVTYEDHNVRTGIGSIVASFLMDRDLHPRLRRLGITGLGSSGSPEDLYRLQSLDTDSLVRTLEEEITVRIGHRAGQDRPGEGGAH